MIGRGLVAYGGAWLHRFRHGNWPLRHRMGRHRALWACSSQKPARSIRGGGCSSFIPMPANFVPPMTMFETAIEGIASAVARWRPAIFPRSRSI